MQALYFNLLVFETKLETHIKNVGDFPIILFDNSVMENFQATCYVYI